MRMKTVVVVVGWKGLWRGMEKRRVGTKGVEFKERVQREKKGVKYGLLTIMVEVVVLVVDEEEEEKEEGIKR